MNFWGILGTVNDEKLFDKIYIYVYINSDRSNKRWIVLFSSLLMAQLSQDSFHKAQY